MTALLQPGTRVEPWVPPAPAYSPFFARESPHTIHGRFEEIVRAYPMWPALTSDGEAWSYGQLNAAANRVAWRLIHAGLRVGDRVALLGGHHPAAMAAHLGISKAGGGVVPLDPRGSPQEIADFAAAAGAWGVLAEPRYPEHAVFAAETARCRLHWLGEEQDEPEHDPQRPVTAADLYALIYSSGTTGRPKGIPLTHEQRYLQSGHYADALGIGHGDRWSFLHPLHSAGSFADFVAGLLTGATLAMYDAQSRGFAGMADWIRRERLTVLHWIPSGFRRLVGALAQDERFASLRMVLLGSEPALSSDLAAFQRHFEPPCRFVNRFAAAEAGCCCLYVAEPDTPVATGVLPAGKVIPAWKIAVVDEAERPLPPGQTGTIAIRSPFNSSGYRERPDLTDQAFRGVPGSRERVWLSGDLGKFAPDGTLIHLGRSDFIVKIRGRKVALLEVEAVVLEHPGVAEAAAIACPAPGGDLRVVAYVVPRPDAAPSLTELHEWTAARLPDRAQPERYVFVSAFPRTRTGKLDRRALPDPGSARPELDQPYVPPASPLEEELATLWSEVLGVNAVGRDDLFGHLGGNSLRAAQVVARILRQYGVELTLPVFMKAPTVALLAEQVLRALLVRDGDAALDDLLSELE